MLFTLLVVYTVHRYDIVFDELLPVLRAARVADHLPRVVSATLCFLTSV